MCPSLRGSVMHRSKVCSRSAGYQTSARSLTICLENILFDLPYVEERYRKVLEACALLSDLEILEDGDESEIGERGVRLHRSQTQLEY